MEAKEAHDTIKTRSPDGQQVRLVRRYHLVATQQRGEPARSRVTPIRYELETGESVEHLQDRIWLHPLTGEKLQLVDYGAGK